jgi:hypothetical protein
MLQILATAFGSITAFILAIFGIIHFVPRYKSDRQLKKFLWWCLGVSFVFGVGLQIAASMHERTYKTELVLRYQDKFNEDKMTHYRAHAAAAINKYMEKRDWNSVTNDDELDGLENVLDFFDELGFYWKSGDISGTVLHEHFYFAMRTYCQETTNYIHRAQKKESKADWENVEPLFIELTQIEAKRIGKSATNCLRDAHTLQDNLNAEIRLEPTKETIGAPISIQSQTVFNVASNAMASPASSNQLFHVSALGTNLPAFNAPNAMIGTVNVINSPSDTHIKEELTKIREDISKTNEVTTHQLLLVTKLVSELDERTKDIQRLPDGRTSIGGIIAVGSSFYFTQEAIEATAALQKMDFASAFPHFNNAIKAIEAAPESLHAFGGEMVSIKPESKSAVYLGATSCALVLQSNNLVVDYAYKAFNSSPTSRTRNVLVTALTFSGQLEYFNKNYSDSFRLLSEGVTNYEATTVCVTNLPADFNKSLYSVFGAAALALGKTNEVLKAQEKLEELSKVNP